jgi:intracellular sulfur oxidation DsrE/DsrF family protein
MPNQISSTVILVTSEGLGSADLELQHLLAARYFALLAENDPLPNAVCFYTSGVHLVVEGSPVLELLATLEKKGVRLIICSTCLDYFGLRNRVRVGIVGSMADIIEAQFAAEKVITI